ncbi:GNAT family N-acetyltransferase [Metallibacterium scheffleri]|uniref:GNAT family N-acetyltransferase n=1 Tax=Metallibacterium scheffleri TaxID=993689 RepID=UPI0023F1A9CB|nr:GNAT family N-acetyltransferase [Metallibacterium scheffleri]
MLIVQRMDGAFHDREAFDCGEPSLNQYLRALATQHRRAGVATTHVLVDATMPPRILGYYSLAAAQMSLVGMSAADQRRLPRYPVPVARLARLAVTLQEQGHGLGEALLQDAVKRCLALRSELGIHALLVDALHERAAAFYRQYGFRETAEHALTLYLPLGRG